jgi:anti-sigma B factor antagonist
MNEDGLSDVVSTHFDVVQGVSVLRVVGELDMTSSEPVRRALLAVLDATTSALVLDLSGVTFLASSGLALIVEAAGYVDQRGISLVVVAGQRVVLRPLQVTNLDELLTIHTDLDQALAALRGTPAIAASSSPDVTDTA